MDFHSVLHTPKNEIGLEEVEIEFKRTFWQRIVGRPCILAFERWPTGWRNKATGEYATVTQRFQIAEALAACR